MYDGKPKGTPFSSILPGSISISREGKEVAFAVEDKGKQYIVRNFRQDQTPYDLIDPESLKFGEKNAFHFVFKTNEKVGIMKNGKPEYLPDGIVSGSAMICPIGRTYYYHRSAGSEHHMVVGTTVSTTCTGLSDFVAFSPDGKRFAFYEDHSPDGFKANIDGKQSKSFERLSYHLFISSQDSRHVAFLGITGGKSHIVIDDTDGPEYDDVLIGPSQFQCTWASSKKVRYIARIGGEAYSIEEDVE